MPTKLAETLRAALAEVAIPEKAPGMQAYMKSAMPYLGVPAPALRRVVKRVVAELPTATAAAWQRAALSLWRGARFREERYAAVELTGDARARSFQTLETLPMYEEMIVTGAWWDYVDLIAKHRLGPLLAAHPAP